MASTEPPKKPFHIAVIGGGIGGLCMTIGLLRQNISCTLYEAASAFGEIGAGVSFGPNAIQAMSMIDPAIQRGYESRATGNGWKEKGKTWFDFRMGMTDKGWKDAPASDGVQVESVFAGEVGQSSIHRAHFLDVLVALVPGSVTMFGKRLENLEQSGNRVLLSFQDGTMAEADAVLGCDGIKSRTRQILLDEDHEAAHATFSGKYAYRGLIPMDKAVSVVGEELARNCQMYMGHHGHVLTFPIEKGKTMNVVAFRTKEDGKWDTEKWVLPMKKEAMLNDFKGWGGNVRHVLSLMENGDIWALFDHPPAKTYYHGRLCLVGDAAHASTPHQGAGAGQAIEDAFILSNLLGKTDSAANLENAFRAYDAVRRPRSQKVVTTSRKAVELYEFEDEELGTDLYRIRQRLSERMCWIWEDDLQEQLIQAQNLMNDYHRS